MDCKLIDFDLFGVLRAASCILSSMIHLILVLVMCSDKGKNGTTGMVDMCFFLGEGDESQASDEEPEAVRPATGGLDDPARECYGAVTLAVLGWQGRW